MMLIGIRDFLLIINKIKKLFYNLLGNGKHLGINIKYKEQKT